MCLEEERQGPFKVKDTMETTAAGTPITHNLELHSLSHDLAEGEIMISYLARVNWKSFAWNQKCEDRVKMRTPEEKGPF